MRSLNKIETSVITGAKKDPSLSAIAGHIAELAVLSLNYSLIVFAQTPCYAANYGIELATGTQPLPCLSAKENANLAQSTTNAMIHPINTIKNFL